MFAPLKMVSFATLVLALSLADSARADLVYLSIGDSLAFGYDPSTPSTTQIPSYGDQGYVRPFATFLAGTNGGVRPDVLNLAIAGEESTSFLNPANLSPTGPPRAWQLNLNYTNATTSQNDLMLSQIAAVHAAGGQIGYVSLVFGANDIFALANSPAFQAASQSDQAAMVGQTITTSLTNYAIVLTELKTLAPEAKIFLPGYYNPFPAAVDPTDHGFYSLVLGGFNPGLQSVASQFGAKYVDTLSLIDGNELALTNIGTGDVHPNQAGYALIGSALNSASVPEPSSLISLAIALGGVGVASLRRRRLATRESDV